MELNGEERVRIAEEIKQAETRFVYIGVLAPIFTYFSITTQMGIWRLDVAYLIYTLITILHLY